MLNVSVDHLVFENVPRRALHGPDHGLGSRLDDLGELSRGDRSHLLSVIDAFVINNRLRAITGGGS